MRHPLEPAVLHQAGAGEAGCVDLSSELASGRIDGPADGYVVELGRSVGVVEVRAEAVGVDHLPRDFPDDGRPHEADAVRDRQRPVHGVTGARVAVVVVVTGEVGVERGRPQAVAVRIEAARVRAVGPVRDPRVARFHRQHGRQPVAPALAHLL